MKLKTLLITAIGAFAIAGANAGETVPSEKAVIEEEAPSLTGDLSAGYDTRYIYRGLWFGDNPVWGNLAVAKEISPKLTLSANAFYIDIADNDLAYSEVNLGGGIAYESEFGTFALGAIYYGFLDGFVLLGNLRHGRFIGRGNDVVRLSCTRIANRQFTTH